MSSPPSTTRRLLVSIHDVTPALAQPVRALWSLCERLDVTPALFVVPNWHGEWPLESHPEFTAWIRECAKRGAEIFVHGERHDEIGLRRHWKDELRAIGRTANEGEFLTLERDVAEMRVARAFTRLHALQLRPCGFVAPAWLARSSTYEVVRELGMSFSEDDANVHLHTRGEHVPAPAVRWSARTAWRAVASGAVASVRWRQWQKAPVVRIALHPQDLAHPTTAASLHRELARWSRARRAIRYEAL